MMLHETISQEQLAVLHQLHQAGATTVPPIELDDLMALGQSGLVHFDENGHTCLTDAGVKLIGRAGSGSFGTASS